MLPSITSWFFFFFNDTATTEIYTLSLHDALPILIADASAYHNVLTKPVGMVADDGSAACDQDRKSTRLNSSHVEISYAVFCLKKKKKKIEKNNNKKKKKKKELTK